jgi:hypothetical protein
MSARSIEGWIVGYMETHGIYRTYCKMRKLKPQNIQKTDIAQMIMKKAMRRISFVYGIILGYFVGSLCFHCLHIPSR